MSETPSPPNPDDPRELLAFLIKSNGRAGDLQTSPEDEGRSLQAFAPLLKELARQHGIDLRAVGEFDDGKPTVQTDRAKSITKSTNPDLDRANANLKAEATYTSSEKPTGERTREVRLFIEGSADLHNAIGSMKKLVDTFTKGAITQPLGMAIKFGKELLDGRSRPVPEMNQNANKKTTEVSVKVNPVEVLTELEDTTD